MEIQTVALSLRAVILILEWNYIWQDSNDHKYGAVKYFRVQKLDPAWHRVNTEYSLTEFSKYEWTQLLSGKCYSNMNFNRKNQDIEKALKKKTRDCGTLYSDTTLLVKP